MASPTLPDYTYNLSRTLPSIPTYRHLRRSTGLWDKSAHACALGLPRSLFCVQVLCDPPFSATSTLGPKEGDDVPDARVVGMGRLVGDGALCVQIVDVAVLPFHQGHGLGRMIMGELMRWLAENVPEECYVNLIAAGESRELYEEFRFVETARGGSVGMSFKGKLADWSK